MIAESTKTMDLQTYKYNINDCESFMKSRDKNGDLSNMTGGMPIKVNNFVFQSSEGLYQAYKFPHNPTLQRLIGQARSGMEAKNIAYHNDDQPVLDWDDLRIDAMRLALAEKLQQNLIKFSISLITTRNKFIVEQSYKNTFWGAKPIGNLLVGQNILGKLLTELRNTLRNFDFDYKLAVKEFTKNIDNSKFIINGL